MNSDNATTARSTQSDGTWLERFISRLEVLGLNAARLILAIAITLAVIFFVLGLVFLAEQGLKYVRETSADKYRVDQLTFTPQFSNVKVSGKAQTDPEGPINIDRKSATAKSRDQLIGDRLAYLSEAGLCVGADASGKCPDLATQKGRLMNDWESSNAHGNLPDGSTVTYAHSLSFADSSEFYGEYGFGTQEDTLRAEWDAINSCLGAYKAKNGNLYYQNAPELFDAIAAECDSNYNYALRAELSGRPPDWTPTDTASLFVFIWLMVGLGVTIITIALTIIFFRLEVSFRALRNLDRLS